MHNIELEYQGKLPILRLNPFHKYLPDQEQLKHLLHKDENNDFFNLVLDLSNCYEIDTDFFISLTNFADNFIENGNKLGIIIPTGLVLRGLKIKLINEMIDVYENKYDALHNLLS
jgi:hypothetical protein